jgi:APA family basic amino acid/polyamine antiporter
MPDAPRPFRTPWVPAVPILGALICLAQMIGLPLSTWERLVVWLAVGLVVYFTYSRRSSALSADRPLPTGAAKIRRG